MYHAYHSLIQFSMLLFFAAAVFFLVHVWNIVIEACGFLLCFVPCCVWVCFCVRGCLPLSPFDFKILRFSTVFIRCVFLSLALSKAKKRFLFLHYMLLCVSSFKMTKMRNLFYMVIVLCFVRLLLLLPPSLSLSCRTMIFHSAIIELMPFHFISSARAFISFCCCFFSFFEK